MIREAAASGSSPAVPTAKSGGALAAVGRFFSIENRYLPPLFITLILLVGQVSFGVLESFSRTLLAIGTAVVFELVLARLVFHKWPVLASAYITGISVGILIRSPEYWPYALTAAIAITSKYVIRWRGRHLWNPSNFAISAMLLLAPEYIATLSIQWGNTIWPMLVVWVLGAFITWRVKRFHITATYVVSFVALAGVRTLITGHPFLAEVSPITGPMYQLFIFFMITDRANSGSVPGGRGRTGLPAGAERRCPVFRADRGGADRHGDRYLAFAAAQSGSPIVPFDYCVAPSGRIG